MTDLREAVTEYLAREKAANAAMRGADHTQILDDIAREYGIEFDVLAETTLDQVFSRAN